MPRYRVIHRVTGEAYEVEAPFAQDACGRLGWMIGDCHVRVLREGPFTGPERPVGAAMRRADGLAGCGRNDPADGM